MKTTTKQAFYHTSPVAIKEINRCGRFDSFLFFSLGHHEHGNGVCDERVYRVEVEEDSILEASRMWYEHDDESAKVKSVIEDVMDLLGVDYDEALLYLDESEQVDDAGASWDMQALTAKCAVALGYRGVAVTDEHGTSYMIDMLGRESELIDVTK